MLTQSFLSRYPTHTDPCRLSTTWPIRSRHSWKNGWTNTAAFDWARYVCQSSRRKWLAPVISHHCAYRSLHGDFNSWRAQIDRLWLNHESPSMSVSLCLMLNWLFVFGIEPVSFAVIGYCRRIMTVYFHANEFSLSRLCQFPLFPDARPYPANSILSCRLLSSPWFGRYFHIHFGK